jgi:hypothetical protein
LKAIWSARQTLQAGGTFLPMASGRQMLRQRLVMLHKKHPIQGAMIEKH